MDGAVMVGCGVDVGFDLHYVRVGLLTIAGQMRSIHLVVLLEIWNAISSTVGRICWI